VDYIGDELELFRHANNWKTYWSSALRPYIKGSVLEVGAGLGGNIALLQVASDNYIALEPDAQLARSIDERQNLQVVIGTTSDLDQTKKYDTLIYIDVLEHIENDQSEFDRAVSLLKKEGCLIVLCPAHQFLYSPFDKAIGHFRRYNKSDFKTFSKLRDDVKLRKLTYLDSTGMLASVANKLLLKAKMPTVKQVRFWDNVLVPMSRLTDILSLGMIGKTVVGVWQKV